MKIAALAGTVALAAVLSLAACGGSTSTGSHSSTPSPASAPAAVAGACWAVSADGSVVAEDTGPGGPCATIGASSQLVRTPAEGGTYTQWSATEPSTVGPEDCADATVIVFGDGPEAAAMCDFYAETPNYGG